MSYAIAMSSWDKNQQEMNKSFRVINECITKSYQKFCVFVLST